MSKLDMRPKLSFYLAHPILDRDWIRKEEIRLEEELGIELVNPFYDGPEQSNIKAMDAGKRTPWDGKYDPDWIVDKDLKAIDDARGLLAFITESETVGTIDEIFYSARIKKYSTFLILSKEKWWLHPWLNFTGITKFKTLKEFEEWFKINKSSLEEKEMFYQVQHTEGMY